MNSVKVNKIVADMVILYKDNANKWELSIYNDLVDYLKSVNDAFDTILRGQRNDIDYDYDCGVRFAIAEIQSLSIDGGPSSPFIKIVWQGTLDDAKERFEE